jgi:hypothetical protein
LYLPHKDQKYWLPWNNRKHLHFFDAALIKKCMEKLGFKSIIFSERDLNHSFIIIGEKMKNCISVVNIPINQNTNNIYELCIDSIRKYSKKYSIDLIEFNTFKINTNSIVFEKFQNLELFNLGYDRILQIDADVLINPNAQNIFEVYNDSSFFMRFLKIKILRIN